MNRDYWYRENNEEYILECLRNAKDLSAGSDELKLKIRDWSTEYQFSPSRQTLFLPFLDRFKGKKILEVGAGMGAITRFLGEHAKDVVAIEPSEIRVEACRLRCRGLKNVDIQNISIGDYQSKEKFDMIVLVGVLEYAGKMPEFANELEPGKKLLESCSTFLKEDGALCVAIENKISQKYFLPNREDHTALYSESLHDFPNNKGFRTFNKPELIDLLKNVGYPFTEFFYPFSDYKTPISILSDLALSQKDINPTAFLFGENSKEYFYDHRFRYVDEYSLLNETYSAGILKDLANSFLVFATKKQLVTKTDWLVKRYSSSKLKNYRTEITLNCDLTIHKRAINTFFKRKLKSKYLNGKILKYVFLKVSLKETFHNDWVKLLKMFFENAKIEFDSSKNSTDKMEIHIDNFMLKDNSMTYFDKDIFRLKIKDIIFTDVIIRNLFSLISKSDYAYKEYSGLTIKQVIIKLSNESISVNLTEEDFMHYVLAESQYTSLLNGNPAEDVEEYISKKLDETIINKYFLLDLLKNNTVEEIIQIVAKNNFLLNISNADFDVFAKEFIEKHKDNKL